MVDRTTKIKWLLSLTVVTSVALLAWIFLQSRLQHSPSAVPLPEKETNSAMALSRIHHTATKDGAVQWELEAGSAKLQSDNGQMLLESPQVDFFLKNGGLVKVKARKGILNTHNNDVQVQGNVRVVYDSYTLTTEALTYHHQQHRLQTFIPVQINGQIINLTAASMIYDLDTNTTTFSGDVKGTIYEKPAS